MKRIVSVVFFLIFSFSGIFAQDVTGTWNGALNVGGSKLRIVFHIQLADQGYVTTMDSPDQGAKGIPTSETIFNDNTLTISIKDLGAIYKGTLKDQGITGTFTQMGQSFTLDLTKAQTTKEEPEIKRPQEPKPPFPYHSEDIFFENKEAGIELAGTFTYPTKSKNFPVAILISGSGKQNRDEELMGHKPFLVLSDYLTRNGIAVLRFDDRGAGESEGDYISASIQDFATDAAAAIEYLKNRKEIDKKKIGLIGHSEGGQISFILGGKRNDIAFIVTLAGPGVVGTQVLKEQRQLISERKGVPQQSINQNEALVEKIFSTLKSYPSIEDVKANIDLIVNEIIPEEYKQNTDIIATLKKQVLQAASPELRSLMEYDPTEDMKRINIPVLALNGDKDLQVFADSNLGGIKQHIKNSTIIKYPGLNHLFQHANTGLTEEYAQIEETISPEVLKDIAEWINKLW